MWDELHHSGMFLQGKQADAPQEALQVLDIVLRELPTSRYVSKWICYSMCFVSFPECRSFLFFHLLAKFLSSIVGIFQWAVHSIHLIWGGENHSVKGLKAGVVSIKVFVPHRWAFLLILVSSVHCFVSLHN